MKKWAQNKNISAENILKALSCAPTNCPRLYTEGAVWNNRTTSKFSVNRGKMCQKIRLFLPEGSKHAPKSANYQPVKSHHSQTQTLSQLLKKLILIKEMSFYRNVATLQEAIEKSHWFYDSCATLKALAFGKSFVCHCRNLSTEPWTGLKTSSFHLLYWTWSLHGKKLTTDYLL